MQRALLKAMAGGKCELCGNKLGDGWHADHIVPFSKGGSTTLANGQALCAGCNLRKGVNTMSNLFFSKYLETPREWQQKGYGDFERRLNTGKKSTTVIATPGSGKTKFAIGAMLAARDQGHFNFIIIVAPTNEVQMQWEAELKAFGLRVGRASAADLADVTNSETMDVLVTSYAMLSRGSNADAMGAWVTRHRTGVVLDEIHHAGDRLSYSDALNNAFGHSEVQLCLSGTPFRSDSRAIPFLEYDAESMVKGHVEYTYTKAIDDFVCRAVQFNKTNALVKWTDEMGMSYGAYLDEPLEANNASKRLAAAIDSGANLGIDLILQGMGTLGHIRKTHKDAAGLIVCENTKQAQAYAERMEQELGEKPMIVHSGMTNASNKIDQFRKGKEGATKWLIAVNMVAEGVDIKRLRVCVYLHRYMTRVFFRQVVGRIVRYIHPEMQDGEGRKAILEPNQTAYMYILSDERLVEFAREIEEMIPEDVAVSEPPPPGPVPLCPECEAPFPYSLSECPECGYERPVSPERTWTKDGAEEFATDGAVLRQNDVDEVDRVTMEALERSRIAEHMSAQAKHAIALLARTSPEEFAKMVEHIPGGDKIKEILSKAAAHEASI